jgi:hypothetical protein
MLVGFMVIGQANTEIVDVQSRKYRVVFSPYTMESNEQTAPIYCLKHRGSQEVETMLTQSWPIKSVVMIHRNALMVKNALERDQRHLSAVRYLRSESIGDKQRKTSKQRSRRHHFPNNLCSEQHAGKILFSQ